MNEVKGMNKDTVLVPLRVSHYEVSVMLEALRPLDVEEVFKFISREAIKKIEQAIRKRNGEIEGESK